MDRSAHRLFIEGPQVFQAPAAAANHQHVDRRGERIHARDRAGDFIRGSDALDSNRHDQHVDAPPPPPQHLQEVANRARPSDW